MIIICLYVFVGTLLALVGGLVIFAFKTARRIEAAIPPAGRFITVQGQRLHYLDVGAGPVLLMIHGLASQMRTFTYALTDRLPGYRIVLLDRPGSGYSQAGPSAALGAQADLIAAFQQALGIEKALVVGHSLGGAVALALAVDHPECVAGLALLAPASQAQELPPDALRSFAIRIDLMRWIIGWTLAVPMALRAAPKTVITLFGPDPAPSDFGTRGGGLLSVRPWTFRNAARDLEAAIEIGAYVVRYPQIDTPVGVLYGTCDKILDYRLHGETLVDQIAGLELELIEQGGHMVPLSAPDKSAALIQRIAAKAGLI